MYKTSQIKLTQALNKAHSVYAQEARNHCVDHARRMFISDLDMQLTRISTILAKLHTVIEDDWFENHVTEQYIGGLEDHPEIIPYDEFDPAKMGTPSANGVPLTVWLARYFDVSKRIGNEAPMALQEPVGHIANCCSVYGDVEDEELYYIVLPSLDMLFPKTA